MFDNIVLQKMLEVKEILENTEIKYKHSSRHLGTIQKAECNINNMFEESQITNVSKKEE